MSTHKFAESEIGWLLRTAAVEKAFHESLENFHDFLTYDFGLSESEYKEFIRQHAREINRLAKELEYWQHGAHHPDFLPDEEFILCD